MKLDKRLVSAAPLGAMVSFWTVDIATLPGVESGCKGYRVPL